MNDTGQIALAGKLQVSAKDGALYLSWREHTKVVQAELADSDHLRLSRHLAILSTYLVGIGGGIMRVCSHTCKDDARVCFRQCERSPAGGEVTARVNHAGDATLKGCTNDGFAVVLEARGIDVCVAIDEQTKDPFQSGTSCFAFFQYSSGHNAMSNLLRGAVHFFAWLGQAQPLLETATRLVPHTAFAWSSSGWACPSHAQHLVYCFPSSSPLCTLIVSTASKPLRGYLSHLVTMMVNRVTMTENSTLLSLPHIVSEQADTLSS